MRIGLFADGMVSIFRVLCAFWDLYQKLRAIQVF